jgi:small subunit ribosomal protein S1
LSDTSPSSLATEGEAPADEPTEAIEPSTDEAATEAPVEDDVQPQEEYTPRQITEDDLAGGFAEAIDATMVSVEDGQLVHGTVVKIDKDEVLLDIGYKSEGVIPARELSIRNDVDPNEIVGLGEEIEALVLTKEDKEGRAPSRRSRRPTASSRAP